VERIGDELSHVLADHVELGYEVGELFTSASNDYMPRQRERLSRVPGAKETQPKKQVRREAQRAGNIDMTIAVDAMGNLPIHWDICSTDTGGD
jgi:hypothetical protein